MSSYATWNQFDAYAVGDVVSYAGQNYVAATANQGVPPFPATPTWTLLTPPAPPGGVTNPLTANLDAGNFDITNTNDTQTTTIGVDVINLRTGSLAPRITVSAGADFTSLTPTLFTAAPRTTAVPAIGDDLCNKTYVDANAGPPGPPGPAGAPGASFTEVLTSTPLITTVLSPTSFTFLATGADASLSPAMTLDDQTSVNLQFKPPVVVGSDTINLSVFIPSQYGYLLYPGTGPTQGLAVPVYAGSAAFYDSFAYNAGDYLSLSVPKNGTIYYSLNGVVQRSSTPPPAPTPTVSLSCYATNVVIGAGPYTFTNVLMYPFGAVGPAGAPGAPGAPGAAATIAVGSTSTLAAGSPATVTNVGTSSAAVFDFGIPEGVAGAPGAPGAAATIAVGSTTTLAAGSSATVTNVGSSSAAVFNFGIPQGATGPSGSLFNPSNAYWVAKNGSDAGTGSINSPFLTIGKALSLVPTSSATGYTITVLPGLYAENLTLTNKNVVIRGTASQSNTFNTTINGNHTMANTGSTRETNTVVFRDLQVYGSTVPFTVSTSAGGQGGLYFVDCKFGEVGATGTSIVSCGATCDVYFRFERCRAGLSGTQVWSAPLFNFNGTAYAYFQLCQFEYTTAQPLVAMNGSSLLVMGTTGCTNYAPGTSANGIVFLNSTLGSTASHNIGVCSFAAPLSTGATGTAAAVITANGSNSSWVQNLFAVRLGGAPATHAIAAGAGATATVVYYASNFAGPGYAFRIVSGGSFTPTALQAVS